MEEKKSFVKKLVELPNHIKDYFSDIDNKSKEAHHSKNLFGATNMDIDLKTELTWQEAVYINVIYFNNDILVKAGLEPVWSDFADKYLRLKVSKDRASRSEYVNVNSAGLNDKDISRFANLKTFLGAKE